MVAATINGGFFQLDGNRIRISVMRTIAEFPIPSPARCAELAGDDPAGREFWTAVAKRAYGPAARPIRLDYAGNPEINR
ncbi:hypothetical protein SH661x_001820 [Planctomicrobium sp. SH661]|uniref:hypothetical protein n=1 Tax=Planctomicrobium sp. SH661 TaxID=3448124 RepID=UPI003F5B473E